MSTDRRRQTRNSITTRHQQNNHDNMKHLIIMLITMLPATLAAVEKSDTTFIVNDKKIVVNDTTDRTVVTVYDSQGYKLIKTREMEYVDGQEVEQVYVGSPLIPVENLQNISFRPQYPMLWYGLATIGRHPFSNSSDGLFGRRKGSFEIGITPFSMAIPFNKSRTIGLTAAVQAAWVRHNFSRGYALGQEGGRVSFTPLAAQSESNNINYGLLRVPVMLSLQQDYTDYSFNIGLSAEVRTNAKYRFTPASGTPATGVPDVIRLNRFGLNAEMSFSIGCIVIGGSFGLTPLFKTTDGNKAYTIQGNIGIDVLKLCRSLGVGKKK